jgi:outer membrane protein assembly factor BamB
VKPAWLLGAALFVVACGGSVDDNDWTLEGVSPDGRHLLASTFFGGVASDCTRFEGWEVAESEEAVEIRARLWRRRAPSGCTDDGAVELLQIDLDEPLGDRPLVGCGQQDCRESVNQGGEISIGQVVAASSTVAVAGDSKLDAYGPGGEVVAEVAGASSGAVLAIGDHAVVRNDRSGTAVAVDLSTGEAIWRTAGSVTAAGEGVVYVCRGQDTSGLAAVDATTGEDHWASDRVCESLVSHGELLTILGQDPSVDGGHRLAILDAATGKVLSDKPILDGYDDQVTGFEGAIAVGANTIASGFQADLVVLDENGTELARQTTGLGYPMGQADGVAIIGGYDQAVAYDPAERSELWTLDVDALSTISVADESVWSLDRSGGTVSRLDPTSGRVLWTTQVGLTSSFDVAAHGDGAYILTTQALIAVDNRSGEIQWSVHRPLQARPLTSGM